MEKRDFLSMTDSKILRLTYCRYFIHAGGITVNVTKKALRNAFYSVKHRSYTVDLNTYESIQYQGSSREKKYNYYTAIILL